MIAVICARSGSKRIKNKNIINFFGKPIISYVIQIAKNSKIFSKIYVSTDSKKIKKVSEKAGAKVPYLRKKKYSDDTSTMKDALKDFCSKVNFKDDYVCCIYSTSVLLEKKNFIDAYKKIKNLNFDLIVAIKEFESDPKNALIIKNKYLRYDKRKLFFKKKTIKKYSDAGAFFIFKKNSYFKNKYLPKKSTFIELGNLNAVDVNEKKDLELLKSIYKGKKCI
tara:strand:- start:719 stop:1384 length:666 start_codon:yes stop_codon:yes gene_type:complete